MPDDVCENYENVLERLVDKCKRAYLPDIQEVKLLNQQLSLAIEACIKKEKADKKSIANLYNFNRR
jgi:hypothetical protein